MLQFNTGRPYTKHGQRIVCKRDGADVLFHDVDRNVYGRIQECKLDKDSIMNAYDNCAYISDRNARNLTWMPETLSNPYMCTLYLYGEEVFNGPVNRLVAWLKLSKASDSYTMDLYGHHFNFNETAAFIDQLLLVK